MTTSSKILATGMFITTLGLAGFVPSAYYWYRDNKVTHVVATSNPTEKVTTPTVVDAPKTITGKPRRLIISSLGMDLPVTDGIYDTRTGQWTLSTDKVHYALMTVQPNDKQGNTLIYGHYRPEVFARLHLISAGARAQIETTNGYVFTYIFQSSSIVNPSDTSILSYQGEPMLTLQTCTGAFMQNRQLFGFKLVSVEKISKN